MSLSRRLLLTTSIVLLATFSATIFLLDYLFRQTGENAIRGVTTSGDFYTLARNVGNGSEFVESLLAKETSMAMGTIHSLAAGAVVVAVLCVASVAALETSPQADTGEIVVSSSGEEQVVPVENATEVLVDNDEGGDRVHIATTGSSAPSEVVAVVESSDAKPQQTIIRQYHGSADGTGGNPNNIATTVAHVTAQASRQLSMLVLKSN